METTEQQFMEEILDDLERNRLTLPTLPEVALRIRDVVEDERATAGQIADTIAQDAALSARLLQVVNSPLYRGRSPIDNLKLAVARLGNIQVRNLVTGLAMRQMFQATDEELEIRLHLLWQHSVQVAAISAALSAAIPSLQRDQAMLAGLIHDVGALPILAKAEEREELLDNPKMLDNLIRQLHGRLGGEILRRWDFPEMLVVVAEEHDHLERDHDGGADYTDLVMVANLQSYIGTDHPHTQLDWSRVPAFSRVGLEPEIQVVEMEEHGEGIREIEVALGA